MPSPRLRPICNRCKQPREGLVHICRSNSTRRATVRPQISFGKCKACGKPYGGNPLTHVCKPKSDFKARKTRAAKAEKAAGRKKRQGENHDYQACSVKDCPRALCVAFKTGRQIGFRDGFDEGFAAGAASASAA